MKGVSVERLDHLGVVAGICQEIGLAEYLDALAGPTQQQVSVGTATVAMILNGLGFSNRRLYLVSQFFATKPVRAWVPGQVLCVGAFKHQALWLQTPLTPALMPDFDIPRSWQVGVRNVGYMRVARLGWALCNTHV